MPKAKIQNLVDQLQAELEQVETLAPEKKEKLENLINDIERRIDDDIESEDITETLAENIAEFEASYPRVTNIINDIMVTLSNLGI